MQIKSVRAIQSELEIGSALLVASIPNRFYLTGFETSDGFVFITNEKAVFLIDFRYVEKAKATVKSCEVKLSSAPLKEIAELCRENEIKTLYCESEYVSLSFNRSLCEAISPAAVSDSDRFDKLLREMRSIKSEEELSLIKQAQKLTDDTFSYILGKSASRTNLNDTYAIKLTNKMTIGDAVEIMAKMDNAEREHLAYFIEVIGKSKK